MPPIELPPLFLQHGAAKVQVPKAVAYDALRLQLLLLLGAVRLVVAQLEAVLALVLQGLLGVGSVLFGKGFEQDREVSLHLPLPVRLAVSGGSDLPQRSLLTAVEHQVLFSVPV